MGFFDLEELESLWQLHFRFLFFYVGFIFGQNEFKGHTICPLVLTSMSWLCDLPQWGRGSSVVFNLMGIGGSWATKVWQSAINFYTLTRNLAFLCAYRGNFAHKKFGGFNPLNFPEDHPLQWGDNQGKWFNWSSKLINDRPLFLQQA